MTVRVDNGIEIHMALGSERVAADTLERARKGDLEALESLFRAYQSTVYHLARRLLNRAEEAEEVLQETFLEVARSVRGFRGDGSLAGWIRRIAVNKSLMRLRSERLRQTEALPEVVSESVGSPREAASHVRLDLETALEALAPVSRAVVWLHDVEGYTHEEIAEGMQRSVSFSKSQLARAHRRLRHLLEGPSGQGRRP